MLLTISLHVCPLKGGGVGLGWCGGGVREGSGGVGEGFVVG